MDLKLAELFGNNMVLQQQKKVKRGIDISNNKICTGR